MKRKWMTRLTLIILISGFLWLAKNLTQTPQLTITERDSTKPGGEFESMTGEVMETISFDRQGRRKVSVKARRGKQLEDEEWVLSELELEVRTRDGNTLRLFADRFREDRQGTRVIESDLGSRISFAESDGFRMQTPGPVVMNVKDVFSSDAPAEFQWGDSKGGCEGMRYRSDSFFELTSQAWFHVARGEHPLDISADKIFLDLQRRIGFVDRGRVSAISPGADVGFAARDLVFFYVQGEANAALEIREFHGIGAPGRVSWAEGVIEANSFVACFSQFGPWLEQMVTGPQAAFSLATLDGHRLRGQSGALTIDFDVGQPTLISSPAPVNVEGTLDSGEPFFLQDGQNLTSTFSSGRVADTIITGRPSFAFRNRTGRAGSIRLLHSEGRILLSQGADLRDEEERLAVQGEEILLANWDQDDQEIFARQFVRIDFQNQDGTPLSGSGDQLELKLPDRRLHLKGSPAKFTQGSNWVEAQDVRVAPQDGAMISLVAESLVRFSIVLDGQACVVEGDRLELSQETGNIELFEVQAAQVPELGELAADRLVLETQSTAEGWQMSSLNASGQVIFEGVMEGDGEAQPVSCQADELAYLPETQDLILTGIDRDVIVLFGSESEHRSRQLTFNLKDGRMHADSGKHGFPKTFLNIKDKQSD